MPHSVELAGERGERLAQRSPGADAGERVERQACAAERCLHLTSVDKGDERRAESLKSGELVRSDAVARRENEIDMRAVAEQPLRGHRSVATVVAVANQHHNALNWPRDAEHFPRPRLAALPL